MINRDKKEQFQKNWFSNKFYFSFSLILIILLPKSNFSCSCDYAGDFLIASQKTDFIGLVKISEYSTTGKHEEKENKNNRFSAISMKVEILETYLGKDIRKTIIVHGDDNGASCKPSISRFKIGEYYVLSLFQGVVANREYSNSKFSEYFISSCGEYWLKVDTINNLATTDFFYRTKTNINIKELKVKFKKIHKSSTQLQADDLNEVFQEIFDYRKLQKHYKLINDTLTNQINIEYFPGDYDNLRKVVKFNKPVKIFFKEELTNKSIEYYFEIKDLTFHENKSRIYLSIDLLYHGKDLIITSYLIKKNGRWKLKKLEIEDL